MWADQINFIVRLSREFWANFKAQAIIIFCRSVVISIFLPKASKTYSCHPVNTRNMVTYEASLKNCNLNCFIDKAEDRNDWDVFAKNAGFAQKSRWTVITYNPLITHCIGLGDQLTDAVSPIYASHKNRGGQ